MPTVIIGNSKCSSPYNGAEKITVRRTGLLSGEWVELVVPTNIITTGSGVEIATQNAGWQQAGADGSVTFDFNASPADPVVSTTVANGWVLPAGTYQMHTKVFSDKTGVSIENVLFEITGAAAAAVTTAVKNRARKK